MFSVKSFVTPLRSVIAKNTVSQLLGRVSSTMTTTLISLGLARWLGADGFGDFVKITTYVGFYYLFADFGLNALFIQRASRGNETTHRVEWQRLFGLRIGISTILMVVAIGILQLVPFGLTSGYTQAVRTGIIVALPLILFQSLITTANAWFQLQLRYDQATAAQVIGSVVQLATFGVCLIAVSQVGVFAGVIALVAGSLCTVVCSLIYVRSDNNAITPRIDLGHMKRLLVQAFPLGITLFFNLIYFHVDSVILTLTRSTAEVGIYGMAYKVFELPLVLPIYVMNALYPLMVRRLSSTRLLFRSLIVLVITAVCLAVALWFFAPFITIIKADFSASIEPLRMLVVWLPVFFLSAYVMWVLIAKQLVWQLAGIHGSAMVLTIVANAVYIPIYGYRAAALITGLSELYILVISSAVLMYVIKMKGERL